jgi:hypothetical protein
MFKNSFKNIMLYIFVKYLIFYVVLMFKNNNYMLIRIDELKTGGDWFYYLWIFLYLPIVSTILFSVPIYFSFKLKKNLLFTLLIGAVFIAEYFLYTYLASTTDRMNGVYLEIIGILIFLLFFYRHIVLILRKQAK